jgi:hypothetical protein
MSDEFGLTDEQLNAELTKDNKAPAKKVAAAKNIDPEDDRDNWPVIQVDHEDGKSNFEFISVSGTKKDGKPFTHDLRVMRGVDVPVPPSVVGMLRSSMRAHYHQTQDPTTGRNIMHKTERPPIPWRMVEKGKYC